MQGAVDQTLKKIPSKLHNEFHAELDRWKGGKYSRRLGTDHFRDMSKQEIINDLREFYQKGGGGKFKKYLPDFEQAVTESGY